MISQLKSQSFKIIEYILNIINLLSDLIKLRKIVIGKFSNISSSFKQKEMMKEKRKIEI